MTQTHKFNPDFPSCCSPLERGTALAGGCVKEATMKYKIINSDILLDGKLIPENSEVDLSPEETKGIEDYIILIEVQESSSCHSERAKRVEESLNSNKELKPKSKRSKK
jgi:hypothetical protein